MRWLSAALLAAMLAAPLGAAALGLGHSATITATSQVTFAPLSGGDKGTATIGTDGATATVSVADSDILTADDVLDITSSDASWQVRAQYVSHTGFTGLTTTMTLSLADGLLAPAQIEIAAGVVVQATGLAVDLATTQDTQLFADTTLLASGTLVLELIITRDGGGGPVIRYPVTVTVT